MLERKKALEQAMEEAKALAFDPSLGDGNIGKRVELFGQVGPSSIFNGMAGVIISTKAGGKFVTVELDTGHHFATKIDLCRQEPAGNKRTDAVM